MKSLLLPALTVLAGLFAGMSGTAAAEKRFDPFAEAGIATPPGARAPADLPLRTSAGDVTTLGRYVTGDRPVVLAPVYYDCPNICGLSTESLLHGLAQTPLEAGTDYRVVFVSFDPSEGAAEARTARETSLSRIRAMATAAASDSVAFLSGDAPAIRRLLDAIGYRIAWDPQLGQYAHANAFAVLTPDGAVARWINAVAATPLDLRLALVEAGNGTTGSLTDFALMMCYQYDPETGRYGAIIDVSLKTLALLLILGLGGYIGVSLWREHRR